MMRKLLTCVILCIAEMHTSAWTSADTSHTAGTALPVQQAPAQSRTSSDPGLHRQALSQKGHTSTPQGNTESTTELADQFTSDKLLNMPLQRLQKRTTTAEKNCRKDGQTLTCMFLPPKIPHNITTVKIMGKDKVDFISGLFTDKSWEKVLSLEMTVKVRSLQSNCFTGLTQLLHLSLNCFHLQHADNTSWQGLQALTKLQLTGVLQLTLDSLQSSLSTDKALPSLEQLILNPQSVKNKAAKIKISDALALSLIKRPLTCFNVSNLFVEISYRSAMFILIKVDYVNLTNSFLYTEKPMGMNSAFIDYQYSTAPFIKDRKYILKSLDISGLRVLASYRTFPNIFTNKTDMSTELNKCSSDGKITGSIENIYANNFERVHAVMTSNLSCTGFHFQTKSAYLRRNNLIYVNATIKLDPDNELETMDLSENSMRYISPAIFKSLNLKKLYLSHNSLHYMSYKPEFSKLFESLVTLQTLKLDNNHLSLIPYDMFRSNRNLRMLKLAWNNLKTITFDLLSLERLQYLDLQHNTIHYIDEWQVGQLDSFIAIRTVNQSYIDVSMLFQYNPIECSCPATPFLEWFLRYMSQVRQPKHIRTTCSLDSAIVDINSEALSQSKIKCYTPTIIACSVSFLIIVLVGIAVVKWVRKRKLSRNWVKSFKINFLQGNLPQNHVVFTAMSSYDEDFIMENFVPSLQKSLQKHLKSQAQLICTGRDFQPGFPIMNEARRLIGDSSVLVAMVSKKFCQSNYCKMEVQEAINQQRPVVMVLLETVEEESMSPYLQEIFCRNTRVQLIRRDSDKFDLKPNMDMLVESIVHLAAERAANLEL